MQHILVYEINDFPEMGGGLKLEFFVSEKEMDNRVNELADKLKERFDIKAAGRLHAVFYKPVTFATKFERE